MKTIALLLIIIGAGGVAPAQDFSAGARSEALAGISAGLGDVMAVFNNPAGLAESPVLALASSFEERFLQKELARYLAAGTLRAGHGGLGLGLSYQGFQAFSETQIALAYGKRFGEKFCAGIQLIYVYCRSTLLEPGIHKVGYGAGTQVILSPRATCSFYSFNPFQFFYRSEPYSTLPTAFRLGFSYGYTSSLTFHLQVDKEIDYPPVGRLGLEYVIGDRLILRGGISGLPLEYAFGAACRLDKLTIGISSGYHQYLGFTPTVTLSYEKESETP